ncbi:MAG: YerC/YecD family TrpR-related protein [Patescibacteria group bacterium]
MNFSLHKLPQKERIRLIGEFYNIIASLKNRSEVRLFLNDLLDPNEIGNLMRRIDVAILLVLGFSYEEIVNLLKVSKAKITNVQKVLNRKGDGCRLAIKRILEKRRKRKIKEIMRGRKILRRYEKPNVGALKRRYPLHFLFWNIIDELGDYFEAKKEIKSDWEEARDFYRKQRWE